MNPNGTRRILSRAAIALLLAAGVLSAGWIGDSPAGASFDFFGEFEPVASRALGGAGAASSDGVSGWFRNPATFPGADLDLSAQFANDPFGGQSGSLLAAKRADSLSFRFVLGASKLYAVEELDERAERTGTLHEPGSVVMATGLSWRFRKFVFGYGVGLATDRISKHERTAIGWWMDAGALWNATRRFSASLALTRLGRRERAYAEGGDAKGWLPAELTLGTETKLDRKGRFFLLGDLTWPAFGESSAQIGLKWNAVQDLAQFRAGTKIDFAQAKWVWDRMGGSDRVWRPQTEELFAAGAMLSPGDWGVDYAIGVLRDGAGLRHALALRLAL